MILFAIKITDYVYLTRKFAIIAFMYDVNYDFVNHRIDHGLTNNLTSHEAESTVL